MTQTTPLNCGRCEKEIEHDAYFLSAKSTAICHTCMPVRELRRIDRDVLNCSWCGRACHRLLADPRWHCSIRCKRLAETHNGRASAYIARLHQ